MLTSFPYSLIDGARIVPYPGGRFETPLGTGACVPEHGTVQLWLLLRNPSTV
jgi:hypothetical protein